MLQVPLAGLYKLHQTSWDLKSDQSLDTHNDGHHLKSSAGDVLFCHLGLLICWNTVWCCLKPTQNSNLTVYSMHVYFYLQHIVDMYTVYMFLFVYIYIFIYLFVYIYIYTCMHIYIYIANRSWIPALCFRLSQSGRMLMVGQACWVSGSRMPFAGVLQGSLNYPI